MVSRRPVVCALGVLLLALIVAAVPAGRRPFWSSDEARFALLAKDVLDRGKWLVAEVRGETYLNKPQLFFWAVATWWIPLLLILMIWRHVIMRFPLRYEAQYWSMAFPLAMYTTGTLRLANALRIEFLETLSHYFLWIAAVIWLVTFGGMIRAIARASLAGSGFSRRDAGGGEALR